MHMMKQKKQFVKPAVLQELTLLPETPILVASIIDTTTVTTQGQRFEMHDFSDPTDPFNHNWEAE